MCFCNHTNDRALNQGVFVISDENMYIVCT